MLSKLSRSFLVRVSTIMLSLSLVQCSYFFSEKEKASEIEYENNLGSCIGEANSSMSRFFARGEDSEVTEAELDAFGQCYQEAIQAFVTYTKSGREESGDYSAENIELLTQRFHPEVSINAERIRGYIRLKSFLIGGEEETVSKEELQTLRELMPEITQVLKNLLPHRSIFLRLQQPARDQEGYRQFDEAFRVLKFEVGRLMGLLEEHPGARETSLRDFSIFMMQEMFAGEADNYFKYLTLIEKFKDFVIFEEGPQLRRDHLSLFVRQVILTYEALTRFEYFLKEEGDKSIFTHIGHVASFVTQVPAQLHDSSLFRGVGLRALSDIMNSVEAVMSFSLRPRPQQRMSMEKLREVLLALEESGGMSGPLRAETLSYFIRNFARKWLEPERTPVEDINLAKISYIKSLVQKWVRRQQIANTLFADPTAETISLLNYEQTLPGQPELVEWYEIFRRGRDNREVNTHQWDDRGRVTFRRDINHFSYEELTVSNSISMLVELFMKPFNPDESNPLRFRVSESEAQEIYEVTRVLGVEMAFMDSRVNDSGNRAFMEINNFSTQKRSDDAIDFYEGYEYFAAAISAGKLADWLYDDLPEVGGDGQSCFRQTMGVLGRPVVEAQCFRDFLKQNFLQYFGHLTTVSQFWLNANDLQRNVFLRTLEVASRSGSLRDKPYDLGEIRVTVSVIGYLEAIFYMFDEDTNGLAEGTESTPGESELRLAEPHFRKLIWDFLITKKPEVLTENAWIIRRSCGLTEAEMESIDLSRQLRDGTARGQDAGTLLARLRDCLAPKIFIHLLRHGNLPLQGSDICGQGRFAWIMLEVNENVAFRRTQATPGDVLKVFSAIAKITNAGRIAGLKEFILQNRTELLASLRASDPPDCRQQQNHPFCAWGRLLYCNENIFPDVYHYFQSNQYRLFPRASYAEDADEAVETSVLEIYEDFSDGSFSTLCSFPPTFPQRRAEGLRGAMEDCVLGEGEEAGVIERGQQILEDVGQGLSDLWDSL